jgi:hypothetical protein
MSNKSNLDKAERQNGSKASATTIQAFQMRSEAEVGLEQPAMRYVEIPLSLSSSSISFLQMETMTSS